MRKDLADNVACRYGMGLCPYCGGGDAEMMGPAVDATALSVSCTRLQVAAWHLCHACLEAWTVGYSWNALAPSNTPLGLVDICGVWGGRRCICGVWGGRR
jgi:hypothetical protein